MIFGAILAGGKGTRMQRANLPKQYLMLGKYPVIIVTIMKYIDSKCFDEIYVACHKDWIEYMSELIRRYIPAKQQNCIKVVQGGKERIDSFSNIMDKIIGNNGLNDEDVLICHDSVRPFVTTEMIKKCVEVTLSNGLAQVVIPAVDTMFTSYEEGYITGTLPRNKIYSGQTPTGFQVKLLHHVLNSFSEEEKSKITGTTQLFVNSGYKIGVIDGHTSNFKITTDRDYELALKLYEEGYSNEN